MLARAALVLCSLFLAALVHASETANIASWSNAQCTPGNVIGALTFDSNGRQVKLDTQLRPLYDAMMALAKKAKDPNKSVGSQLSGADNERFGEIRQRVIALQSKNYVESVYQEHLYLLSRMAQAQDESYRWGDDPDKSEPYYLADAAPHVLQALFPTQSSTPAKGNHCSLDYALATLEFQSLKNVVSPRVQHMLRTLKSLQAKYGVQNLNKASMTPDDHKVFEAERKILNESRRDTENIAIVEQIRRLAAAARLIYTSDLEDLDASMGDPKSLGTTLHSLQQAGKLSPAMQASIGMWGRLDVKYPSEFAREQQEAAKVQKTLGLKLGAPPAK